MRRDAEELFRKGDPPADAETSESVGGTMAVRSARKPNVQRDGSRYLVEDPQLDRVAFSRPVVEPEGISEAGGR